MKAPLKGTKQRRSENLKDDMRKVLPKQPDPQMTAASSDGSAAGRTAAACSHQSCAKVHGTPVNVPHKSHVQMMAAVSDRSATVASAVKSTHRNGIESHGASPALKRGFLMSTKPKAARTPQESSGAQLPANRKDPPCQEQGCYSMQQGSALLGSTDSTRSCQDRDAVRSEQSEKQDGPEQHDSSPPSPTQILSILQQYNADSQFGPWRIDCADANRLTLKRDRLDEINKEEAKEEEDAKAHDSGITGQEDANDVVTTLADPVNNTRGRYSYSTGGEGQSAWLRIRLPRLDKSSRARLRPPENGGAAASSSEREVLEMYSTLVKKTEESGITVPDIAGPEAFTERINVVRQRIEKEYKEAQDRFKLAKRVASMSDDLEKNVRLLVPAEETLQACTRAIESYRLVQKLWGLASQRIRDAIDETQALKGFNEIEQVEGPALQNSSDRPRNGLFQPYPRDALPPRVSKATDKDACSASWESERLYDEARGVCLRGQFSTSRAFLLLRELDREKEQIENGYPSRQRINRAKAYKMVCNLITQSGFHLDCENHRQFMMTHRMVFRGPLETEVPGSIERFVEIFPQLASSLGVGSPDGGGDAVSCGGDGQNPEDLARADSNMEVEHVTGEAKPLSIEFPCFQRPSAFGDADNDLIGVCVSCLERPALFVARSCGHLTYCRTCQRKAIAQQLESAGPGNSSAGRITAVRRRAHTLSNKELNRTRVICPMCREETSLVAREVYNGKVYEL